MNIFSKIALSLIEFRKPLPLQIDITNFCNLRCTHCYHSNHLNHGALGVEAWFDVIDQYFSVLKKVNLTPDLIICGGEPLASDKLFPIFNYIRSKNKTAPISILTNGVLINESLIEQLRMYENLAFQVSLDGPSESIHDSFRGKGNFSKAIRGIKHLIDAKIPTTIQATLSKTNISYIENFFMLASQLRVQAMNFTRLIASGSALQQEIQPPSPLEIKMAYEQIVFNAAKYDVSTNTNLPLMHLIHPLLGSNGRFGEGIIIDYQGSFLLSSRSRLRLAHVSETTLEEFIFTNPILKKLRKNEIEGCSECPHLSRCGGDRNAAYAKTGDVFARDPGCWHTATSMNTKQGEKNEVEVF